MSGLGIKTIWSALTHGTLPIVDGKPMTFDVWLSPSVPDWDYEPTVEHGPFRMIRAECDTEAVYGYVESPQFHGVVNEFATLHMPRKGECCMILDRHPNIVLGWLYKEDRVEWLGCEYAFSQLAFHHPVNAAIWERRARHEREIDLEAWL